MKYILTLVSGLALGIITAISSFKYWAETSKPGYAPNEIEYTTLFKLASTNIKSDKFDCEGIEDQTVGAVLSYILKSNSNFYVNNIYESCNNNTCTISHSSCNSWRQDECGSTILRFNLITAGNIDIDSFQCLQVP